MTTTWHRAGWRKSSYSAAGNGCVEVDFLAPRAGWRKSSYSAQANGCVEVDFAGARVEIRDTKLGEASPIIGFTAEQWTAWLAEVTGTLTNTNGAVTVTAEPDQWTVTATDGTTLVFDDREWLAFRAGVTDGEFDPAAALATR